MAHRSALLSCLLLLAGCGRSELRAPCEEVALPASLPSEGWSLEAGTANQARVLARFASTRAPTSLLVVTAQPGEVVGEFGGGRLSECGTCLMLVRCPGDRASCELDETRTFAAVSGGARTMHSRVTMFPGTMRGEVSAARLAEWALVPDAAVDEGDCLELPPFTFSATW